MTKDKNDATFLPDAPIETGINPSSRANRKNILLILVDQYRFPRFSYGPDYGFSQPIKLITGFQEPGDQQSFDTDWAKKFFPGLWSLRQNSVVLRRHYIAASACTPSRATIMTGQYGTRTSVTQTDGTFKNGDSPAFPWLAPDGIPTIGSWMRQAGYSTHYFGKWHVSNPPDQSLRSYGFDDWELSYPEPHGSLSNNLGAYRDYQFADLCAAFLRRRGLGVPYAHFVATENYSHPIAVTAHRAHAAGLGPDVLGGDEGASLDLSSQNKPWFAVISFTNPHDIAAYPSLPRGLVGPDNFATKQEYLEYLRAPLGVPEQGWISNPPQHGTTQIEMNPLGFPTGSEAANVPPTMSENLSTKPRCQYDYSYKMGLTLASKLGWSIATGNINPGTSLEQLWHKAAAAMKLSGLPFQNQEQPPEEWVAAFIRYYAYLIHVVDEHIARVLNALHDSGLEENTIVIFTSDHGEYGGAHGMLMEKWHTAYEEALHVPLVVRSAAINADPNMKQCDALTSHVDLLPTILGFAGVDEEGRQRIRRHLRIRNEVPEPVGCNIAQLIENVGARSTTQPTEDEPVSLPNGAPRRGVLFITDDEITAPLTEPPGDPHSTRNENEYQAYKIAVSHVAEEMQQKGAQPIAEGSVIQPNHVRCVVTSGHKLARYCDPDGKVADEWEMYDLIHDPNEVDNLLAYDQPFPTAASNLPPWAESPTAVEATARELRALLAEMEATML